VVDGADYEHPDPGAHQITLATGSAASFALGTNTASGTVYMITALSIALPGDASPLKLSVRTGASAFMNKPVVINVTAFVKGAKGPPTG
jgi:hypothetical protein